MRGSRPGAPARHVQRGAHAVRRDEAEHPGRGRVAATGDDDGAEPLERRLTRLPIGLRQQGVRAAPRSIVGQRPRLTLRRPRRAEERAVGPLRSGEAPVEVVDEDRGAPVDDRKVVAPQLQDDAERQVRGQQRVRGLAREMSAGRRDPDADRVELARRARPSAPRPRGGAPPRARPTAALRTRRPSAARPARSAEPDGARAKGARETPWRAATGRGARRPRGRMGSPGARRRGGDGRARARSRAARRARRAPARARLPDPILATPSPRGATGRRPPGVPPAPPAASNAAGPPWRMVSAEVSVTTRSLSSSSGLTCSGSPSIVPISTSAGSSTSCTSTRP